MTAGTIEPPASAELTELKNKLSDIANSKVWYPSSDYKRAISHFLLDASNESITELTNIIIKSNI